MSHLPYCDGNAVIDQLHPENVTMVNVSIWKMLPIAVTRLLGWRVLRRFIHVLVLSAKHHRMPTAMAILHILMKPLDPAAKAVNVPIPHFQLSAAREPPAKKALVLTTTHSQSAEETLPGSVMVIATVLPTTLNAAGTAAIAVKQLASTDHNTHAAQLALTA